MDVQGTSRSARPGVGRLGGVASGANPRVLRPDVDRAMTRALLASRCKILTSGPDGAHREVMLADGDPGFGLDGTRCYMNLEATVPALRWMLRPAEVAAGDIDRVNAYLSRPRCGAPLHFDTRTIWVVQLVGTKLWLVSKEPAVAAPHRNCVAPPGARWVDYDGQRLPVPVDLGVTLLRPGDWLRVPRAAWHATYAPDGSVSATLAAPPTVAGW